MGLEYRHVDVFSKLGTPGSDRPTVRPSDPSDPSDRPLMTLASERLNPYASFLGERDPLEALAHTADHLRQMISTLEATRLVRRPAPAKWSIRDILCHLADSEIVFGFRAAMAVFAVRPNACISRRHH